MAGLVFLCNLNIIVMMIDEEIEVMDVEVDSYKRLNKQLHRKIQARNKKIKYPVGQVGFYMTASTNMRRLMPTRKIY